MTTACRCVCVCVFVCVCVCVVYARVRRCARDLIGVRPHEYLRLFVCARAIFRASLCACVRLRMR